MKSRREDDIFAMPLFAEILCGVLSRVRFQFGPATHGRRVERVHRSTVDRFADQFSHISVGGLREFSSLSSRFATWLRHDVSESTGGDPAKSFATPVHRALGGIAVNCCLRLRIQSGHLNNRSCRVQLPMPSRR